MILTDRVAAGVAAGSITLAFRRWMTPRVRPGFTFRSTAGVVTIGDVSIVAAHDITVRDAEAAGAASVEALIGTFRGDEGDPVFRIELAAAGPDPRTELADDAALTEDDCTEIDRRLRRLDQRSPHGAWTLRTLRLIQERPGQHAESLRGDVDKETFKRNVRKLKELGLTRSLPEGYEIARRGSSYLAYRMGR